MQQNLPFTQWDERVDSSNRYYRGKTDLKHILKAMENLVSKDVLIYYNQRTNLMDGLMSTRLLTTFQNKSHWTTAQSNSNFDRDIPKLVSQYPDPYKQLDNNVFAFCIPCPESRKKKAEPIFLLNTYIRMMKFIHYFRITHVCFWQWI